MTMWLGIFNSNSNSKQGQGQGAAVVAMVLVCVCTISISMSMLPLATSTIHHEGGAQSQGAPGANPNPNPNPANLLVALVNADRAAARLPTLRISKGLGCMALQYISRCTANSASVCAPDGTLSPPCHPPETDITEVYAANCGVELPTVDVISLSGRILGCTQSSEALHIDTANATVVRGREHAQVGAGVHRGRFWCLLFSSGSPNSTFLLEAAGRGIAQEDHGCFSDPDVTLSCTTSASAGHHQTTRLAAFAMPLLLLLLLLL